MALIKARDVRAMTADERSKKLAELRQDLMHERGIAAMGGSPPSPGKIRQLRTAIARILTIENQDRAGKIQYGRGETPRPAARPAAPPTPARKAAPKSEASKARPASPRRAKTAKPKEERPEE